MNILITPPHSVCINKVDHLCDYLSDDASINLEKQIKYIFEKRGVHLGKTNIYTLKADKNREKIDYNRNYSRDTKWRKILRRIIDKKSIKLLLDIHSFPPTYNSFGYFENTSKVYPEIVILDSYIYYTIYGKSKFLDNDTSIFFKNYLLKKGILVKLLRGGENDIIIEGREHDVKSILIEYNESLSKERLNFINKTIADYFYKMFT